MQVPSKAELARFFGEERAADVQFVETVASWTSLRVLDYLYVEGSASTGEIARSLNMDMRDVKDRLEALESQGVVVENEEGWTTTTDRIQITFEGDDGLGIERTVRTDEPVEPVSAADSEQADERVETEPADGSESADEGVLSRVTDYVRSLFR